MQQLEKENRLTYTKSGRVYEKRYLDESLGVPAQRFGLTSAFFGMVNVRRPVNGLTTQLKSQKLFWNE